MVKSEYDFRALSVDIVRDTLKDFAKEYYALGRSKIFMMLEVVALFDKAVQKMVSIILTAKFRKCHLTSMNTMFRDNQIGRAHV